MSLPAKKVRLLISAALLFLFFSCNKDQDIGLEVEPDDLAAGAFYTDTFTIQAQTVLANEAIVTSNSGYLMAGTYTDPYLGKVTAKAYTQLRLNEETPIDPTAVVDSVRLFLTYDYAYGDRNQFITVNVHRLTSPLQDVTYYSYSDAPAYDPQVLGSVTYKPADFTYVPVTLPVDFGTEILFKRTNGDLIGGIPGLALIPGSETNGALIRYDIRDQLTKIHVFYHTATAAGLIHTVRTGTDTERFYQINGDRTGTISAPIINLYDSLSSDNSGGISFIQAGTGLTTRIKIPGLKNFKDSLGEIMVNKAILEIPFSLEGSETLNLLEKVTLYKAGEDNKIKLNSSGAYDLISSSNEFTAGSNIYSLTLTAYMQDLFDGVIPNNGIYINPGSDINMFRVNRVLLQNNPAIQRVIKLKLYYTVIR